MVKRDKSSMEKKLYKVCIPARQAKRKCKPAREKKV